MLLTTLRICADTDGESAIKDKMTDPLVQELVQKAVVEALEIVDGISGPFTVEVSDTTALTLRRFIVAPVFDEASAMSYIDALVAHDCSFEPDNTDLKTLVPQMFNYDEALFVDDRMQCGFDYIDTSAYMEIAEARKEWAAVSDAKKQAEFFAFEANNHGLSDGDMIALLEWANPGGSYVDLDRGALVTLMEHSEVKPRKNGVSQ